MSRFKKTILAILALLSSFIVSRMMLLHQVDITSDSFSQWVLLVMGTIIYIWILSFIWKGIDFPKASPLNYLNTISKVRAIMGAFILVLIVPLFAVIIYVKSKDPAIHANQLAQDENTRECQSIRSAYDSVLKAHMALSKEVEAYYISKIAECNQAEK